MFNILVTIVFMVLLVMYSKKSSRFFRTFLIFGGISGIIVVSITAFEHVMIGHGILDVIASVQHPFYLIFIVPLFGGNVLFDLGYGSYSLLMSLFYGGVLALTRD